MKNFSTEIYEEAMGKLTFPDYENFGCVNKAYSDLCGLMERLLKKRPSETNCKTENFKNLS